MAKKIERIERNPAVSAILNFVIWGTGYIYNGKRLLLGVGFIFTMLISFVPVFSLGISWYLKMPGIIFCLSHIIISLLLAYDAYTECKKN